MQKKKLIELIQHRLGREDKTAKYNYYVVEGYCNTIYPLFLEMAFAKNDIFELDHFVKRYDSVAVQQDSTTNQYYSDLPENIVNSRYGVRRITQAQGTDADFTQTTDFTLRHMQGQEVDLIDTTIMYVVRQDRG
jgi:hypothetical protein